MRPQVSSPLIFAHVRAASLGLGVADQNCHPFSFGRFLFMHNGGVSDFKLIKRALIGRLKVGYSPAHARISARVSTIEPHCIPCTASPPHG